MKRLLLLCMAAGLSLAVKAQSGNAAFPESFKLKQSEYPKNFDLTKIDEKAKAAGIAANPGLIDVAKFAPVIYDGANAAAINRILVTSFTDKDPEGMEIFLYALEYKSAADLEKESAKFSAEQSLKVFLKRDKYLVIIVGELAGSYKEAVNKIAGQLAQRLTLERLKVADEPDDQPVEEPVAEPVAVPVQ